MDVLDLAQRVSSAIASFQNTGGEQPPFDMEELVVMALVAKGRPMAKWEVYDWIWDNFKYYRDQYSVPEFGESYNNDNMAQYHGRIKLERDFVFTFSHFEIPLLRQKDLYTVTASKAELYLCDILRPQHSGCPLPQRSFHFFDLPPELRDNIYEYTFLYPQSGICPSAGRSLDRGRYLKLSTRSYDDPFSFDRWKSHSRFQPDRHARTCNDEPFTSMYLGEILAPLLASRQFYQEAMPAFYRVNRFHFLSLDDLGHTLPALAPERLKHIVHISFDYPGGQETEYGLQILSTLEKLRRLDIRFDWSSPGAAEEDEDRFLKALLPVRGLQEVDVECNWGCCGDKVKEILLRPKLAAGCCKEQKKAGKRPAMLLC